MYEWEVGWKIGKNFEVTVVVYFQEHCEDLPGSYMKSWKKFRITILQSEDWTVGFPNAN